LDREVKPGPLEIGFDYFLVYLTVITHRPSCRCIWKTAISSFTSRRKLYDEAVMKRVQRKLDETAITLSMQAVRFIEKIGPAFFLYYPVVNIHSPVTPNARFQGRSKAGIYGDFVAEFDWAVGEILNTLDRWDWLKKPLFF